MSKAEILRIAESLNIVFNCFTALVTVIALSIAFFLLMISMSENINESIWEYGVLRSMGITREQGARIYIYEAFMVVTVASILGFTCGLFTSHLVSSQLYLFIELPLDA